MIVSRIISVPAYRTPDGTPTCMGVEGHCGFYVWGRPNRCAAHHGRALSAGNDGFMRPPRDGCIVWPEGAK